MRRFDVMALAALAAFSAAPAAAAAPAGARFDVRMRMSAGDAAPVTPRLIALAGEPATFMIGNDSYALRVTATPDAHDNVAIASSVSYWTPAGLRNDVTQVRIRADGEAATVLFPATDPATGAVRQVRIEVSALPLAR